MCDSPVRFTNTATELRCHSESCTETPEQPQGYASTFPHVALGQVFSITAQEGEVQHASMWKTQSLISTLPPCFPVEKQWLPGSPSSPFQGEDGALTCNHNKTEVWQLMLSIPSAASCLQTAAQCQGELRKKLKQLSKPTNLQPWAVREPWIGASRLSKTQWKLQ